VPFGISAGFYEKLQFHLLEFTGAKGVISRIDFVAEGFSDLGDAEWHLLSGGGQDIGELGKDPLRCFRPEVGDCGFILDRSDKGFEH
jgi:hypothetical protein